MIINVTSQQQWPHQDKDKNKNKKRQKNNLYRHRHSVSYLKAGFILRQEIEDKRQTKEE